MLTRSRQLERDPAAMGKGMIFSRRLLKCALMGTRSFVTLESLLFVVAII